MLGKVIGAPSRLNVDASITFIPGSKMFRFSSIFASTVGVVLTKNTSHLDEFSVSTDSSENAMTLSMSAKMVESLSPIVSSSKYHAFKRAESEWVYRIIPMENAADAHGSPCWVPRLESIMTSPKKRLDEQPYDCRNIGYSEDAVSLTSFSMNFLNISLNAFLKSSFTMAMGDSWSASTKARTACIIASEPRFMPKPFWMGFSSWASESMILKQTILPASVLQTNPIAIGLMSPFCFAHAINAAP